MINLSNSYPAPHQITPVSSGRTGLESTALPPRTDLEGIQGNYVVLCAAMSHATLVVAVGAAQGKEGPLDLARKSVPAYYLNADPEVIKTGKILNVAEPS